MNNLMTWASFAAAFGAVAGFAMGSLPLGLAITLVLLIILNSIDSDRGAMQ